MLNEFCLDFMNHGLVFEWQLKRLWREKGNSRQRVIFSLLDFQTWAQKPIVIHEGLLLWESIYPESFAVLGIQQETGEKKNLQCMNKIGREKVFISNLLCPEIWRKRSYCSNKTQKFCWNFSSAHFDKHFLVLTVTIAQFLRWGNQAQFHQHKVLKL